MSTPIYQLFMAKNSVASNRAWQALSQAERDALFEKEASARAAVNAKNIILCNSAWANEEYLFWGVNRFPDLAARIEHTRILQEFGWFNYIEAFTLLGIAETEPVEVTFPNPIYKLWMIKSNTAGELAGSQFPQEDFAPMQEKIDAIHKETGSIRTLECNAYWFNEAYTSFGVSAYPSLEANIAVMKVLEQLGWRKYLDCYTLLGTPA